MATAEERSKLRESFANVQASAEVKKARERGRQRRSVERTRAQQRVLERQQSEAARQDTAAQRFFLKEQELEARRVQKVQTAQDLAALKQSQQPSAIQNIGSGAVSSFAGSSTGHSVGMIFGIFFALIIVYVILRNPTAFGGLTGGVGTFVQGLSSNAPLFVQKPAGS